MDCNVFLAASELFEFASKYKHFSSLPQCCLQLMQADCFEGSFSFTAWNPLSLSRASFGFVQLRSVLLTCLLIICALGHQFTPALRRWYLGMHRFAFPIILHTSNLFQHALFIAVLRCLEVNSDEPLTLPYIVSHWSPRLFHVTKAMREFTAAYRYRFLLTVGFCCNSTFAFQKQHEYSPRSKTTVWRIASM